MKLSLLALVLVSASAFQPTVQGHRGPVMSMHPVGSEIVDRIGPEELRDIRNSVSPDSRGAILPSSIDGRAQYILNVRSDLSAPERHTSWDDIMIIQHGYGRLYYSRSVKGGARAGEGEWRGGVLTGEVTMMDLAPGVVVRIPAGVPHEIRPLGTAPLVYLVLKEKIAALTPTPAPKKSDW